MIESYIGWLLSLGLVYLIIIALLHFIPAVIAFARGHQSKWAIFAVNLLFGWTFIGWIIAFIWSLTGVKNYSTPE